MTSQSDSPPDVLPLRQVPEVEGVQMLDAEGEQRDRKPPKITVKSARGRPLDIDMEPVDAVRFLSAFSTTEPDFANLLLSGIIKRGLRRELSTPVLPKRAPSQDRRADFGWLPPRSYRDG